MKKNRKILSLALCVTMLITCFVPMSAYAGIIGTQKAKMEFIPLKSTDGLNFTEMSNSEISNLAKDSVFYVGAKISDFDQIERIAAGTSEDEGGGGLTTLGFGLAFDKRYLEVEPDVANKNASNITSQLESRKDSSNLVIDFDGSKDAAYHYYGSCVADYPTNGEDENTSVYVVPITVNTPGNLGNYNGVEDGYFAFMKFKVIEVPEDGGAAFRMSTYDSAYSLVIGMDYDNYTYGDADSEMEIRNIIEYDVSSLAGIFPKGKPALTGTVSIDNTTPTYDDTLTASFAGTNDDWASKTASFQWYRGSTAISGATAATYKLTAADVGQTIKVAASHADYKGSVESTPTAAVDQATLTVTAPSVKDKVFDNKTTAAVTADPTFTGKLGSDDVKVKATATFDNANAGNGKTVNLAYSLDGTAKAAYKLNKTSDTATANITKAPLTVVGENKTVKVGGKVTLTAKVTGEVGGASAGVTYAYALKDGDAITVSGNEATGVKAGSATVTVTGTIGNTTNYEFASGKNTADATVTVSDKVATGITIKTQPTKLAYEAGETLDLSGLEVTVTYDDHSSENVAFADFASKGINASPANGTTLTVADHNGKQVTVTVGGKNATTDNLTVVAAATKVTLKTKGDATKVYDNSTAFGKAVWTTDPVFESNNGTVDTSKAVYTFADKNAGICEITVTGLTVNGAPASISGSVADGTITKADPELVIGNLAQRVGNVTALTAETVPADDKAIADKFTYEIDIKTTDGGINFVDWDDANVNGLQAGSYNVVVNYAGSENTNATTEAAILVLSKRSSGGGSSSVREYTVRFAAGEHGTIDGKTSVSVEKDAKLKSSDVPTVKADEGYKFIGWSLDGKTVVDPTKEAVTGSLSYTALYQQYNAHKTYMSGYSDGTFRPDGRTTRAEVASLMAGLIEGFDKDAAYNSTLNDIEDAAWYAQAVKFMSQKGLISGYDDGSYRPNNQITRQEFCAIIAKYMGLNGEGTANFNDVAEAWGKGYIGQLAAKGIVNGYPDGSFQPDKAITRAEVVTILNKVFDRTPDAELVDENIGNYTVRLSDVSKNHWAYTQILEAAVEHEMTDFHK